MKINKLQLSINLNDDVEFILTQSEVNTIGKFYTELNLTPPKCQVEDLWKGQLWEFANIFGNRLYCGGQTVAQDNEIIFTNK
jgi:hypothetical protein